MSKRTKYQARRPMPRIRTSASAKKAPGPLTLGELITAAYDLIGETNGVARMLNSNALAARIGRHIVVA